VLPPNPRPELAELEAEFVARQVRDMERARERRKRNLRNATIAGAAAGFAAVLVTAGVTRRAFAWHSFLLETLLGAIAGHLLVRWHGGPMKGLLLFAGSYFLAFLLRATGLDPSVLFVSGDVTAAAAVQGHFVSLCFLVSAGMAIGHIVQE
jgi:hypothetical protein